MKKITLITFLLTLPFLGLAQGPWDFNNTDDGWVKGGGCTDAVGPMAWVLTTNGGNNPNVTNVTAGVDADANQFAAITLRLSAGAPTFMRLRFPNATGSYVYKPIVLDPSETDFVTYYIDASNANWTGTVNDIRFQFKDDNGSTSGVNHTSTGETIEIDRIEFINEIPRPEKLVYEFNTDGDDEGFNTIVDATTTVTGGSLVVTPDGGAIAKVTNGVNSVNAAANTYVHIVYKNNSATNNQIRFQFRSDGDNYVGFFGTNISINQSMGSFETLDIDLASARPEWTGTAQDFQVAVRNTANAGNATDANGTLEIDSIIFDNNATLNVEEFSANEISIYPNPAKNVVNISANSEIKMVRVLDITGKLVLTENALSNNSINVSNLKTGVYILNVTLANGNQSTKKLIKQ